MFRASESGEMWKIGGRWGFIIFIYEQFGKLCGVCSFGRAGTGGGVENRAGLAPAQRSEQVLHVGVELAESPAPGPRPNQKMVMKYLASMDRLTSDSVTPGYMLSDYYI
jgi:hypothetical protein